MSDDTTRRAGVDGGEGGCEERERGEAGREDDKYGSRGRERGCEGRGDGRRGSERGDAGGVCGSRGSGGGIERREGDRYGSGGRERSCCEGPGTDSGRGELRCEERERAILVGIDTDNPEWPLEASLDELARLADTAGATVVARLSQRLDAPRARTFIGEGKACELACAVCDLGADVVIFDDELTPSQQANLEDVVGRGVKVIDRTALILDIFALNATSAEGTLQVRLAQNQYLLPRLRGMWSHLAAGRMGGGVGSRFGEGESQLEVDRRLVRKRITRTRRELERLSTTRRTQRKMREESGVFRVALAGYTNAGKSSLMNALCGAEEARAADSLFATLDSTTRRLQLADGPAVTLSDTVGFIQKLPHTLVEAFRSTLAEVADSDLILIVVDASSAQRDSELACVREVLAEIGADGVSQRVVMNKTDLLGDAEKSRIEAMCARDGGVATSAVSGEGVDEVLRVIQSEAFESSVEMRVCIPYSAGALVDVAHSACTVISQEHTAEGVILDVVVARRLEHVFGPYVCV